MGHHPRHSPGIGKGQAIRLRRVERASAGRGSDDARSAANPRNPATHKPVRDDHQQRRVGIPQAYGYFVLRQNAQVEADRSVFFTSDRVAIRAALRVGFGFHNPAAIVKIATT